MTTHTIPVIELWGRLIVSLQGDVSDSQMEQLRTEVLQRVRERDARGMVIDASGMWLVDSHMCAMLGRIVVAARLMGVRAILSGLSPNVVATLGEMGVGLEGITTALTLEEALESLGINAVHEDVAKSGLGRLADEWNDLTGVEE